MSNRIAQVTESGGDQLLKTTALLYLKEALANEEFELSRSSLILLGAMARKKARLAKCLPVSKNKSGLKEEGCLEPG